MGVRLERLGGGGGKRLGGGEVQRLVEGGCIPLNCTACNLYHLHYSAFKDCPRRLSLMNNILINNILLC